MSAGKLSRDGRLQPSCGSRRVLLRAFSRPEDRARRGGGQPPRAAPADRFGMGAGWCPSLTFRVPGRSAGPSACLQITRHKASVLLLMMGVLFSHLLPICKITLREPYFASVLWLASSEHRPAGKQPCGVKLRCQQIFLNTTTKHLSLFLYLCFV